METPKPVQEERFEPKRAPAPRSAPEEPTSKVRKLQLPSDFVKRAESPQEKSPRYREEVSMQLDKKPEQPSYKKTVKLPGQPVQVTPKQKPRFTQVMSHSYPQFLMSFSKPDFFMVWPIQLIHVLSIALKTHKWHSYPKGSRGGGYNDLLDSKKC